MPRVYVHLRGESSKILLQKKGIIKREDTEISNALRSTQCPNCFELCIPGSSFCARSKMILSYNGYNQILENQKEKEDKLTSIDQQFKSMQSQLQKLVSVFGSLGESGKNEIATSLIQKGLYKEGWTET